MLKFLEGLLDHADDIAYGAGTELYERMAQDTEDRHTKFTKWGSQLQTDLNERKKNLQLEESNYNYLIGSNSMKKRIIFGLKKVNFESFIKEENIFSFDMVDKPKPSPDIYISAINTCNLDKKETIIIEDSAVGVQAGVSAGIKVLGLTAGGHWHIGRSIKELTVAGAYSVFDNYTDISREIKNL